jgi:hypothetical protein
MRLVLPVLLFLSVLAFVLAGITVFISAIGRVVGADDLGVGVRLLIRGTKRLAWDDLKPGRLVYVFGLPVLLLEKRTERFLSNPADFILLMNLPKEKPYLNTIHEHLGIT